MFAPQLNNPPVVSIHAAGESYSPIALPGSVTTKEDVLAGGMGEEVPNVAWPYMLRLDHFPTRKPQV
jgi:hypothetical protein